MNTRQLIELRVLISSVLAGVVLIPAMLFGISEGYFAMEAPFREIFRYVWIVCATAVLYIMGVRWKQKLDISMIMAIILGPYTLLIFGFMYLLNRIVPIK